MKRRSRLSTTWVLPMLNISVKTVVREASLVYLTDGWVAVLDAINLPLSSPFHCLENFPYPGSY